MVREPEPKCPACGKANQKFARFCVSCGAALHDDGRAPDEIGRMSSGQIAPLRPGNISYDAGTLIADRYAVERELGRGGMGTVLLCRDRREGDVHCALKVLNPQLVDDMELVERFKSEGLIARKIHHPAIIATHDIFEWQGRWHISMEFFPGVVLRDVINEAEAGGQNLPLPHAVAIVEKMLEGLTAAHKVTVHRDLKPENVMLRGAPDSPDFQVKILDFGIAKNFEISDATMAEVSMGTTGYMAPEQARDAANVDARADLYAVAVIFYELLTGLLPVGNYEPVAALRPGLPAWVDAFVDQGLRSRPDARYDDAAEMRATLLAGGDSEGPRPSRRTAAGPLVEAAAEKDPVKEGRWLRVKLMNSRHGLVHAVAYAPDGSCFATAGEDGLVRVWDAKRLKLTAELKGHSAWVRSLHFSPNSKLLASGGGDKSVRIWDARTWREASVIRSHGAPVVAVRFSPDGHFLTGSAADQSAIVWETADFTPVMNLRGGGIAGLSYSPDGLLLAGGTLKQSVTVWDLLTGETLVELEGHRGTITAVTFSPDGRYLLTGSDDATVRVYEVPGFERTLKVRDHSSMVWSIAFTPDARVMASAGEDRFVVLRSLPDWGEIAGFADHPKGVSCVVFGPEGRNMVTAGRDGGIAVYSLQVS